MKICDRKIAKNCPRKISEVFISDHATYRVSQSNEESDQAEDFSKEHEARLQVGMLEQGVVAYRVHCFDFVGPSENVKSTLDKQ